MKRVAHASAAVAFLIVALAACRPADIAKDQQTLTFVNFRDIRDLNPHLYGGEMYAQNLIFESLVRITDQGYEPWLAERWDISPDGRVYTFHLRRDVYFSDGEKFNAAAAKANFDAILDNRARHGWLEMVRLMKAVEVIDEYVLRISLAEPYFPMLTELAVTRPMRFISPRAMRNGTTKDGVNGFIGTGPYVLAENVVDQQATFLRNENYWGPKPAIQRIVVRVIPDNQARVLALQNGEIDMIFGRNMIDAETYKTFSDTSGFAVMQSDPVSTRALLLNTTRGALTDVRVRRALQHAVDKNAISEGIFSGLESPADFLFARTVRYSDVPLVPYEFSTDRAAALLEEAGWIAAPGSAVRAKAGVPLSVALLYNINSVPEKAIAEYLQSAWRAIGVDLRLRGEEEQSYRDRQRAGDFDIVFKSSWGTPYDPQSFLNSMRTTVYGDYAAQQGLAEKARLDESILNAMLSVDTRERQALFNFILTYLHEEAVYLPLTYERNRAVFNARVQNVRFNPVQFEVPFEKMSLKN